VPSTIFRILNIFSITLMFSVIASSGMSQGLGGVRKGLYGAKRQVMREVNRSKRDANQMNKLLSNKKRDVDPASDTSEYIMWSMAPNVPNSGMIRDYHYVYTFLHNQQE
jgi:hypothetical protein